MDLTRECPAEALFEDCLKSKLQVRPRYNVISGGWEKLCYTEVYVIVSWAHQYAICRSK